MRPNFSATASQLQRYLVVDYLTGSVLFTIQYFFLQYDGSQPSTPIKPRAMTEPGQATFDVENIVYSQQTMKWKSKYARQIVVCSMHLSTFSDPWIKLHTCIVY